MKHAAPVRRAIRRRTIFNLLGPLCNPAGASRQVLGVSKPGHVLLMAEALRALGCERAWVVHGSDGLCDLTLTGSTQVAELHAGEISQRTIQPADAGLAPAALSELLVDSPAASAATVRRILDGESGAPRRHALLNAAAALVVYGVATDLADGARRAAAAIDSGAAKAQLDALAEHTW